MSSTITFEEFQKLDIRIGKIVLADRIEGSDKLLRLRIEIGEPKPRQIVAGIARTHNPEKLVGTQVVILANLKPIKLFGVESNGMLLAADQDGAVLLKPEREIRAGTKVR